MKPPARLAGALLAVLSGCATTGDPQRGGLFGWSETMARERQRQKQAEVDGASRQLDRETAQSETLHDRGAMTDRQITAAEAAQARARKNLRIWQTALVARAERLEAESPTPATASRARALRRKVNTIAAQTALPSAERAARLHVVEAEIDAAFERLNR